MIVLEKYPATKGITTNNTTDNNNVSIGTITLVTPNKNATIGVKAINNIISFTATWTSVYAPLPLVKWLHTNTIAVQGAAPRSTAPAKYSFAKSDGIIFLNTIIKKKYAIAYMVKGLINQLVVQVIIKPFFCFVASFIAEKSIFNIIG